VASVRESVVSGIQALMAFLRSSKKTLMLLIVVVLATVALQTSISLWLSNTHNFTLPSIGTMYVLGVEVYGGDIKTDGDLKYVDWGVTYPGAAINRSANIRSISNVDSILNLETANWTYFNAEGEVVVDPDSDYINLTWNYNETVVHSNETVPVTLTLSVSDSQDFISYILAYNVRTFNLDIRIHSSEYRS